MDGLTGVDDNLGDKADEGVDDDYWHGIKTREGGRGKKGEGGWEGGRKRYLCVVVFWGEGSKREDVMVW